MPITVLYRPMHIFYELKVWMISVLFDAVRTVPHPEVTIIPFGPKTHCEAVSVSPIWTEIVTQHSFDVTYVARRVSITEIRTVFTCNIRLVVNGDSNDQVIVLQCVFDWLSSARLPGKDTVRLNRWSLEGTTIPLNIITPAVGLWLNPLPYLEALVQKIDT